MKKPVVTESINLAIKENHIKWGDADVFGEDSDVRRKLLREACIERFAQVWKKTLEPEVRQASPISIQEARERLKSNSHQLEGYVQAEYQFRQFELYSVPFLARLSEEPNGDLNCDQLWSLGKRKDNTRLSIYFETNELRQRFDRIAKYLGWSNSKELAEKILCDFMNSVDPKDRLWVYDVVLYCFYVN